MFHGHDEMRELLEAVFDTFTEIRYFLDIGDDRTRSLAFRGLVGRQPVEECGSDRARTTRDGSPT